jgi:hypothetical protein
MPDSFLRYRFDRGDPLRRHFHVVDEKTLFFYPHSDNTLQEGARVALEVGFTGSDQLCTSRGIVACASEAPRGVWLEFPLNVATGLEEALRQPKRRNRRISTNLLVNVSRSPSVSHLARLIDLSPTSARLGEISANVGDRLWLRVLGTLPEIPGDLGPVRVTWVQGCTAGVRLLSGSLGRSIVMNLVLRMDGLWASSKTITHSTICQCAKDGRMPDPRPPPAWPGPHLHRP